MCINIKQRKVITKEEDAKDNPLSNDIIVFHDQSCKAYCWADWYKYLLYQCLMFKPFNAISISYFGLTHEALFISSMLVKSQNI